MSIKNKVQLITYPDSLGGNLKILNQLLSANFKGLFEGGIHILPPYPSSGDRGFAPLTYLEIDKAFGSWEDISKIAMNHDILLDLMVNHLSAQSDYFKDFLENGEKSPYADLFIKLNKVWSNGVPVQDHVDKIFLRRKLPYSTYLNTKNSNNVTLWTTFGKEDPSEQVDIDIHSPVAKKLLRDFMDNFKKNKVKIVRLDAVGYVIKKPGSSCFFVEPEIYEFLDWVSALANEMDIELLPEVHSHYSIQLKLAEKGFWIYDFILPFYILETLITKSSKRLLEYLAERPHKQFTMLDCHDGVPVKPDLDELVSSIDAKKVVDVCLERGSNLSLVYSDKHKSADGFDVHQIRGTYYSMLNKDDNSYLIARAIQFFTPGIPQVYYVGLLAGENDEENIKKSGDGREINRHNYSMEEVEVAMRKPVVQKLIALIKFRNAYPAFNGTFISKEREDGCFQLVWKLDEFNCTLEIDLHKSIFQINYLDKAGQNLQLEF